MSVSSGSDNIWSHHKFPLWFLIGAAGRESFVQSEANVRQTAQTADAFLQAITMKRFLDN